ncbi:MAG: hypothetical protein ACKO2Z_29790, partial [Sphaerospermopsis kisseleviana]
SIEKIFGNINLEVNVADDSLVDLNKHLNLKVNHLKEVNKYFNNNPITVQVDNDSLVDLNKHLNLKVTHLKEVNKYFNSNPIVVHTDTTKLDELEERLGKLSNKTITITVESDLSNQLEKSLTDAVQGAVKDAISEQFSTENKQAEKNKSDSKIQKVDVVSSPIKSIIDGAFEGVGKKFTKGLNDGVESTFGVNIETMSKISGNMLLRYFGVGKKAQSDPKDHSKRVEVIIKDGINSYVRHAEANTGKSKKRSRFVQDDDLGIDFESAGSVTSSSVLRYFGVGKKAQSDPKDGKAKLKAIIEDAINDYSASVEPQSTNITSALQEINKAFSDSINLTIDNTTKKAKSALIKQARQTASKFTQGLSPGVQEFVNNFFDADQSNEEGSITNFVGKTLAGQAK